MKKLLFGLCMLALVPFFGSAQQVARYLTAANGEPVGFYEFKPSDYNKAWWDLRLKYQGIAPPSPRGEQFFDPGAKYHVPDNTPYMRYFLANVLEFQFHRALAKAAGCTQPLHRCSIYENKAAGDKLKATLAMGVSRPWPDALDALTGQREMDASAILDYFKPLQAWLESQNKGQPSGW